LSEFSLGCSAEVNLHWNGSSVGTEMKYKRKGRRGNISVEDYGVMPEVGN
jgi:hypothetical protein